MGRHRLTDPATGLPLGQAIALAAAGRLVAAGVRPTLLNVAAACGHRRNWAHVQIAGLRRRGLWLHDPPAREKKPVRGPTPETVVDPAEVSARVAAVRAAKAARLLTGLSPLLPLAVLDAILPPISAHQIRKRETYGRRATGEADGLTSAQPRSERDVRVFRTPAGFRGGGAGEGEMWEEVESRWV